MRWRNDENLAKKVLGVDLILGGHDHDYEIKKGWKKTYKYEQIFTVQ